MNKIPSRFAATEKSYEIFSVASELSLKMWPPTFPCVRVKVEPKGLRLMWMTKEQKGEVHKDGLNFLHWTQLRVLEVFEGVQIDIGEIHSGTNVTHGGQEKEHVEPLIEKLQQISEN